MLYLRHCPKCHGDLTQERDRFGEFLQCLQCGYMRDLAVISIPRSSPIPASVLVDRSEI